MDEEMELCSDLKDNVEFYFDITNPKETAVLKSGNPQMLAETYIYLEAALMKFAEGFKDGFNKGFAKGAQDGASDAEKAINTMLDWYLEQLKNGGKDHDGDAD